MEQKFEAFVGVDWGSEKHVACIVDATGAVLGEESFDHSGTGLSSMAEWLLATSKVEQPERVAVAIEVPRGAIVETLLTRGFSVYSINPKQLDRFRDRFSVAGSKDDSLDARVLGDSARTDLRHFRKLVVDERLIIEVREASRCLEELGQEERILANRLRELLHRYFPQLLQLSQAADERWLWELLEKAPTPVAARRLSLATIEKVLRNNRVRRLSAVQVREQLRQPDIYVADGVVSAVSRHVLLLVPRLRLLRKQAAIHERHVDALLEELATATEADEGQKSEHRDAAIILSLPGAGTVVTATMFAEASQPLAERDYQALRALAGTAPVTRQSGKSRGVIMRRACNGRLREAVYHWSRVSLQHDPRSRDHYARLRADGKTHGRALRGVADRLLAMLIAMLKAGTLYDEGRRGLPPAAP